MDVAAESSLRALLKIYLIGVAAVALVGIVCILVRRRYPTATATFASRVARSVFWLSGAFYALTIPTMSWLKGSALNEYADRATHLEILWRATHGLGLTSLMSLKYHHGIHWFAAHFTPIVYFAVVPFFWLSPTRGMLTILQTVYILSAVIPIFLEAERVVGRRAAYFVGAAFFWYPTLQYINLYGIEYLELSIPALAWTLYFLRSGRIGWFLVAVTTALLVREELGLVVFATGLYAIWLGHRRVGAVVALAGLLYTSLAIKVIIPYFRTDPGLVYIKNYASWGSSPSAILEGLALHPLNALRRLLSLPRVGNVVMYLLPAGFLPIFGPEVLLLSLPNVASTFLSDSVTNYSFTLYYLAPSIPILFFALIDALARLPRLVRWMDSLSAAAIVLFVSLSANVAFGASPVSLQFWDRDYKVGVFRSTSYYRSQYVASSDAAAAKRLAALIPKDAQVCAEQQLLPLVFDRRRITAFPALDSETNYVFIDKSRRDIAGWDDTYEDFRSRPEYYFALVEKSPDWILVKADGQAELFRRKVSPEK